MKRADSESVLRFATRRSVFELQWTNTFLLTDRPDKITYIDSSVDFRFVMILYIYGLHIYIICQQYSLAIRYRDSL